MRQSLDMSNWEDASKKVREWETGVKPAEEMSVKDAIQKFLDDHKRVTSRTPVSESLGSFWKSNS